MKFVLRRVLSLLIAVILALGMIALMSGCGFIEIEDTQEEEKEEAGAANKDSEKAETTSESADKNKSGNNLGHYKVEIVSCRLAEDFEGKPIAIVKYSFTNNDDEAKAFMWSLEAKAYQDGIGLNECYFADDSANYSSDNQSKEIKKGSTLEVEVAYELNDTTTDIEVEVSEYISFNDKKITKVFKID